MPAVALRRARQGVRGERFYEQALRCGQSLWLQGLPAQALLMFNHALGADLNGDEPVLKNWPLPYAAMAWVMMRRTEDQFIGNPRRHFQHLATRVVGPRKSRRSARAWACWSMACRIFPEYPGDEKQIAEEGLREPGRNEIVALLQREGIDGEVEAFRFAEGLGD